MSIRNLLMLCYSGLLIGAVSLVFFFNFRAATQNTVTLQAELANSFVEIAQLHIDAETTPLEARAEWFSAGFADGTLSSDDQDEIGLILAGALAGTPTLDFIGIWDVDDKGLIVDAETGEIKPFSEKDFPRLDIFFHRSKAMHKAAWLPPLEFENRVYLTHVTPLYNNGRKEAILFQAKTLQGVATRLMSSISVDNEGQSFILYGRQRVIGHPALKDSYGQGLDVAMPRLGNFDASLALKNFAKVHKTFVLPGFRHPGYETGVVDSSGLFDEFFFIYRDIYGFLDKPLTVGMYFDAEYDNAEVERLGKSLVGSLMVLLVAVILTLKISAWTARPISALSEASTLIGQGDYHKVGRLRHSHLRELDEAAKAFNNMVRGIQERNRAHELFGRVVPLSVAEKMLRSDGGLAPVSTEGTVVFVDLEGFTSMAEELGPQHTVKILNAYFTDMVDIIEGFGGIITQFQGDAILAVFNVPTADKDHARHALDAAKAMAKRLEGKQYDGHRLRCRIGVNTGPFIAGNVGATSRMNYTVHGDAVNIAARLEQMNKDHGTTVLASAATMSAAGLQAPLLSRVTLRGKSEEIAVYQIV